MFWSVVMLFPHTSEILLSFRDEVLEPSESLVFLR